MSPFERDGKMKNRRGFTALMYSLGYLGISILMQTLVKWYQYFYSPPGMNQGGLKVLIPLGLIGFTMIIGRIFDGVADPLVAYYSDSCKNPGGRRIPFILYGSLPLALTFIFVWFPPVRGESVWNFVYLTVMLSLYFVFFTIVVGPYLALIGEIGKTKKERINLTMMQGITQVLGVMVAEAGSGALIKLSNFRIMGITLGMVAFGTIILTPIFVREDPVNVSAEKTLGLFDSVYKTFSNKNFICYLIPYLAIWFGINTLTVAMPYITEVLLEMPAESSGFFIAGAFVIAVVFSPFLPKITLKLGKKKVMFAASLLFGLILTSTAFFGTLFSGFYAAAIILLAGVPLSAALIVPNAMVADIAEMDGIQNGVRREGMFFGAQGLINKIVIGLSSLVTPLLFNTFGYSKVDPLGLQLCGPIAGITVIIGALFLKGYSLPEEHLETLKKPS